MARAYMSACGMPGRGVGVVAADESHRGLGSGWPMLLVHTGDQRQTAPCASPPASHGSTPFPRLQLLPLRLSFGSQLLDTRSCLVAESRAYTSHWTRGTQISLYLVDPRPLAIIKPRHEGWRLDAAALKQNHCNYDLAASRRLSMPYYDATLCNYAPAPRPAPRPVDLHTPLTHCRGLRGSCGS